MKDLTPGNRQKTLRKSKQLTSTLSSSYMHWVLSRLKGGSVMTTIMTLLFILILYLFSKTLSFSGTFLIYLCNTFLLSVTWQSHDCHMTNLQMDVKCMRLNQVAVLHPCIHVCFDAAALCVYSQGKSSAKEQGFDLLPILLDSLPTATCSLAQQP